MTTEQLEARIVDLLPGAGYAIAPTVTKKSHLPRQVRIEVHVWLAHRTMIYDATTNDEVWHQLKADLRKTASRVRIGDLSPRAEAV